jgi:hypothetical protein
LDTRRVANITRSVFADWILASIPTSRAARLLIGYSPIFDHARSVFADWILASFPASRAEILLTG